MRKSGPLGINSSGFSLVELMMVVAIIGMLSSIGVNSFRMMIIKSRQVEAKASLDGIYHAEESYFAEFGTFSACLDDIGFKKEGTAYYAAGFSSGTANCPAAGYLLPSTASYGNYWTVTALLFPANVTMATFTAGTCGMISELPWGDEWIMTEKRVLTQRQTAL